MSKNNNNQRMKQCIREQQRQIERLKHLNKEMGITLNEMHLHELQQFSDVLSCVFAQCMMDVITEEQAGRLMVALTGAMRYDAA